MKIIQEYKALILKQQFFEAHEALETLWFPQRKNKTRSVLILKGFINAAVAFELKKRNKSKQALKVWLTYEKLTKRIKSEESDFIALKYFVDEYAKNYLLK